MKRITASWKGAYYLYAIKPMHAEMIKIGFYIADLRDLRNRYITPYGRNMDMCVFEFPGKQSAQAAEKMVHAKLKEAGYHLEGELFKPTCMPLFFDITTSLASATVTVAESRNITARKRALDERRDQRKNEREAKRQQLTEERKMHLSTLRDGIINILADQNHPLHTEHYVNAAKFRQQITRQVGKGVRQEDIKDVMAKAGFSYSFQRINGINERVYLNFDRA